MFSIKEERRTDRDSWESSRRTSSKTSGKTLLKLIGEHSKKALASPEADLVKLIQPFVEAALEIEK